MWRFFPFKTCIQTAALLLGLSVSTCLADAILTWPVITSSGNITGVAKGTFGDYRELVFHGGVDIHAPDNTYVRPVMANTWVNDYPISTPGYGWEIPTEEIVTGPPARWYAYAHVESYSPSGHYWTLGDIVDNYLYDGAMTTLSWWPQDYQEHLHLTVEKAGGGEVAKTDPFWLNDEGVETFSYTDSDAPNIVEITYGKYVGPNDTLHNEYCSRSGIPGNAYIDIIVYVNDRSSGWDQKVGIDSLDYAITTTESEPRDWEWNAFVCFHRRLPSDYDIDYVYARDNRWDDPDDDITIPNTVHSGQSSDHIDKMWYIVTNSDGNYNYANFYAWQTPGYECDRYVWVRAVDGAGNKGKTTVYHEKVHINKPGVKPQENQQVPRSFLLWQNYPNPFNPVTQIRYQLPRRERVKITIFNLLGQKVRTLVDGLETAGYHSAYWDGRDEGGQEVAGGIFFCRMQAGRFSDVKKMLLLK